MSISGLEGAADDAVHRAQRPNLLLVVRPCNAAQNVNQPARKERRMSINGSTAQREPMVGPCYTPDHQGSKFRVQDLKCRI